jgi:hypothetical protein
MDGTEPVSDQQPPYPAPSYDPGYPAPDNSNGLLAMILGIVSLVVGGFLLGIPAIILGRKGQAKADAGLATNRDQATVGVVTGIISTALSVIGVIVLLGVLVLAGTHVSTSP